MLSLVHFSTGMRVDLQAGRCLDRPPSGTASRHTCGIDSARILGYPYQHWLCWYSGPGLTCDKKRGFDRRRSTSADLLYVKSLGSLIRRCSPIFLWRLETTAVNRHDKIHRNYGDVFLLLNLVGGTKARMSLLQLDGACMSKGPISWWGPWDE